MLEPIILDNTERLLTQGAYFGTPSITQLHIGSDVVTNPFYNNQTPAECLYNWVLDCFHFQGLDSGNSYPWYRIVPSNFETANAVMVSETTVALQRLTVEPTSGRIWAFCNVGANSGLWRRDPSVTAPNWTKIIGATAGDTQDIWVKTNGDIWYNNATAGNWYQLQNGTAGNAQTSPPSGLYTAQHVGTAYTTNDWLTPFWLYLFYSMPQVFTETTNWPSALTAGAAYTSRWAIHDNSASPSSATYRFTVPYEWLVNGRMTDNIDPAYVIKLCQLNATYSLMVLNVKLADAYINNPTYGRNTTNEWARQKLSFALVNRTTNVTKFLGTFSIPALNEGYGMAVSEPGPASYGLAFYAAKLNSSVLEILMGGKLAIYNGASMIDSLWDVKIPLVKLDF